MAMKHAPKGSNSERLRSRNRQAVMGHIYAAGASGRADIARALGLSIQAASNITADLVEDGLLIETGTRTAGRGLPAVQYAVNPEGGYALGFEVRPDAVFVAMLDMTGGCVFQNRIAVKNAQPSVVEGIISNLRDEALKAKPLAKQCILGAGIVMPGPFGETGLSGRDTDLPDWRTVDATALFQNALKLSVEVSNDANAAAVSERINGVAQGLQNYAYLYFGSGLGLGLISNGQLITGAFGNAGEIGHIPVPTTSGTKPLETALSRLSVQRHLRAHGHDVVDLKGLSKLFAAKDASLMEWLENSTQALSHAVQIVENLFDPQTVILGGAMPEEIMDYLVAHTRLPELSVSNRPNAAHPRLQRGACGSLTATIGAASLVLNRTCTPQLVPLS